jgi:hypothetical protein
MSAAIANGLIKFVESQDITLNYSDKIAPANGMGLWKTSVPISRESPVRPCCVWLNGSPRAALSYEAESRVGEPQIFEWFRPCSTGRSQLQDNYQDPTIRVKAIACGVMRLSHRVLGRKVERRVLIPPPIRSLEHSLAHIRGDLGWISM